MSLLLLNTTKFLKTGDRQAFQALYLQYEKEFQCYARKLTGNLYAEDLIQLTCIQVLEYNGRNKDPADFNFKNFFCRSLHNTFINLCRKKDIVTCELIDKYSPAHQEYEERNLKPLLSHIEKHLNPTQKRVMYMRMQGIKYRRIAIIMGVNMNTARGIFRYGQIILKKYEKEILEM